MAIPTEITTHLREQHHLDIQHSQSLGGGCIHNAQKIQTPKGIFFLKYNVRDQFHNFQVESKGLNLLAGTHTLQTPEVIACAQTSRHAYLVLAFIESGRRAGDYWESFGRNLARLHQHTATQFGLEYDNYIGALPQINQQYSDWITFFIQSRIQPMVDMAIRKGAFMPGIQSTFQSLYNRLPTLLPSSAPALLHGDLWGGNIVVNQEGQAATIDPAVYYGHPEIELAFMTLFDSIPQRFYDAYQEAYPLAPGYQDRFDLYNLYPLLVHVNLFGGAYVNSVRRVLGEFI